MKDPNTIRAAANILLLVYLTILVSVSIWFLRGRLPSSIGAKYPRGTVHMSQLPFTEKWRAGVDSKDLSAFVKARRRRQIFLLVLIGLFTHLPLAYGYLDALASLLRCYMQPA